jgi:hypothetical protein
MKIFNNKTFYLTLGIWIGILGISLNAQANDKDSFNKALKTYEKVHDAFFKRDLKTAQKFSSQLEKELSQIKEPEHTKLLAPVMKRVKSLRETKDVEEAHDDFHVISVGMLGVLDRAMPNKSYARYYCPMVKKYWIQNITESEKVMNPYASDTMPHCGGKME